CRAETGQGARCVRTRASYGCTGETNLSRARVRQRARRACAVRHLSLGGGDGMELSGYADERGIELRRHPRGRDSYFPRFFTPALSVWTLQTAPRPVTYR